MSQTTVDLLRALQSQLKGLGELATAQALELPDTSFTHYRKLGEAEGLHRSWRLVADLADRLQEGNTSADQAEQKGVA